MSAAGMANPSGVLAFLALAALLALYLRIRRRQAIPVATLFLWRRVRAPLVEPRRFRPDALFWLQATILAALAAGYVRPYLDRPTGKELYEQYTDVIRTLVGMMNHADEWTLPAGGSR